MTEHLPECADKNAMPQYLDCFCDVVRACEQRMNDKWEKFSRDQFDAGYIAGVDAARNEAAIALTSLKVYVQPEDHNHVIDAIDALKEETP